jgi:hypothetical protein
MLVFVLLCGIAGNTSHVVAASTNLGSIMTVGDSITYGSGGGNAGYRGPLYSLLTTAGYDLQFVGDSTLNPGSLPATQTRHCGHASYTTYDITNNLDAADYTRYIALGDVSRNPNGGYWITGGHGTGRDAISPNYVLLFVGVNDLYYSQGDHATTNLTALLTKFTTVAPHANILIADLPPSTAYGETAINDWNSAVNSVAAQFQASGKQVHVVDLNTDFPNNGLTTDGVHPNDIGYAWMASQWSDAITTIAVPEPSSFGLLAVATLALLSSACYLRWHTSRNLISNVKE